jgi:hypothetical protein
MDGRARDNPDSFIGGKRGAAEETFVARRSVVRYLDTIGKNGLARKIGQLHESLNGLQFFVS